MSSVSFIAATQPSPFVATGKSVTQQTFATSQPQPADNTVSSATISQAARDALAATVANGAQQSSSATTSGSAIPANSEPSFKQAMAEKFAGSNTFRSIIQNDPSNPLWAKNVDSMAQHDFTAGTDVLYDISHMVPGASGNPTIDGTIRYADGEPVTAESQAYVTQQTASYQNQLRDMISSEKAKGTAPSDILLKIMDQQGQQPTRFRTYMAWPIVSDFASSQPTSTASGSVKPS